MDRRRSAPKEGLDQFVEAPNASVCVCMCVNVCVSV